MLRFFRRRQNAAKQTRVALGGGGALQTDANLSSHDVARDLVTALNVRVVCELATLSKDRGNYERLRDQAIKTALAIGHDNYRSYAVQQVVGICSRAGETELTSKLLSQIRHGSAAQPAD
jgi:hypothetical protein